MIMFALILEAFYEQRTSHNVRTLWGALGHAPAIRRPRDQGGHEALPGASQDAQGRSQAVPEASQGAP